MTPSAPATQPPPLPLPPSPGCPAGEAPAVPASPPTDISQRLPPRRQLTALRLAGPPPDRSPEDAALRLRRTGCAAERPAVAPGRRRWVTAGGPAGGPLARAAGTGGGAGPLRQRDGGRQDSSLAPVAVAGAAAVARGAVVGEGNGGCRARGRWGQRLRRVPAPTRLCFSTPRAERWGGRHGPVSSGEGPWRARPRRCLGAAGASGVGRARSWWPAVTRRERQGFVPLSPVPSLSEGQRRCSEDNWDVAPCSA